MFWRTYREYFGGCGEHQQSFVVSLRIAGCPDGIYDQIDIEGGVLLQFCRNKR